MTKSRIEFDLPQDIDAASAFFEGIEGIESLFKIEFSCGDGFFLSDIENSDILEQYDGKVCLSAIRIARKLVLKEGYSIRLSCIFDSSPDADDVFSDVHLIDLKTRKRIAPEVKARVGAKLAIDQNKVIEVIGRLIGRAQHHKCAADQTPDTKKAQAHLDAHDDLLSLADDLAEATDDPEYARSHQAYVTATQGRRERKMS